MAKTILLIFGWLSIAAGIVLLVFGLYINPGWIFIAVACSALLAGAPLVALATILTLLERIARAAEASAAFGSDRQSRRLVERATQSLAASRSQSDLSESSLRSDSPNERFLAEAERDGMESGIAAGTPWRRRPDGEIEGLIDGRVERFATYRDFMRNS